MKNRAILHAFVLFMSSCASMDPSANADVIERRLDQISHDYYTMNDNLRVSRKLADQRYESYLNRKSIYLGRDALNALDDIIYNNRQIIELLESNLRELERIENHRVVSP